MKKIFVIFLAVSMFFSSFPANAAVQSNPITVMPDGKKMAFDHASVKQSDDAYMVGIDLRRGQHKISTKTAEKVMKDAHGNLLIHVNYAYPIIENPNQNMYISKINKEYRDYAKKFVQQAEMYAEDAKLMLDEIGAVVYIPLEFDLSYAINTDRKGILSITNHEYYNLGGAHPSTAKISRTFDLNHSKELVVADIVKGSKAQRHQIIYDQFVKLFKESYQDFSRETTNTIKDEVENVKFYLTDDSLVLYFDVYQVAPYAAQYPTVVLPYTKNIFKLDWSDGSLDALKVNLEGNPTTGYTWQAITPDTDKVRISQEYIPSESRQGVIGRGGTYQFTVEGIGAGNCSISFVYKRNWESTSQTAKIKTYQLYISENHKITVLDVADASDDARKEALEKIIRWILDLSAHLKK